MTNAFSLRSLLAASTFAAVAAGALILTAPPAMAQSIEDLKKNDDVFIDWLREKGAGDVLEHYGTKYPPKDEKAKISLRIATAAAKIDAVQRESVTLRGAALEKAFQDMRKATEELLGAQRDRCDKFDADEMSVVWYAKLLSDWMDNYLRVYRNDAAAVYEFGQPDPDQTKAFNEVVLDAFVHANKADAAADRYARKLVSLKTYKKDLERRGLKARMDDAKSNIKYYYGLAAYLMTLLPDSHPYYASLATGGTPGVRNQAQTPAAERKRLLSLAFHSVQRDNIADMGVEARNLAGRALAAQGQFAEAQKYYQKLDTSGVEGSIAVQALCGQAKAMAAGGKLTEAVQLLRQKSSTLQFQAYDAAAKAYVPSNIHDQLANGDGGLYLFACDAAFRMLIDASAKAQPPEKDNLFNRAFMEPYADIFAQKPGEDPAVAKTKQNLKNQLSQRWAKVYANTPPKDLPVAVVASKVMVEFSELFVPGGAWDILHKQVEANDQSIKEGKPVQPLDPAKVAELTAQTRRVEADLLPFITKTTKVNAVRAQMLNQLALLRVYGAQAGTYLVYDKNLNIPAEAQTLHASAMDWVTLADELSKEAQAPDVIGFACGMLRELKGKGFYSADYTTACKVLFAKFPQTPAAVAESLSYATQIGSAQPDEAIRILEAMPKEEMLYFVARQKALALREQQWQSLANKAEDAKASNKPNPEADAKAAAALKQVIDAASALDDEARKEFRTGTTPGYRHASAQSTRASAVIALARAQSAQGGSGPQQAVATLEKFETEFAPDTLSEADFKERPAADFIALKKALGAQVEWAQVCRLRMLMDAGQSAQVRARAEALLASTGPDAEKQAKVKGVLFRLNYNLKHEVDRLKSVIDNTVFAPVKVELQQRRLNYGKAMLELSQLLKEKTITDASPQADKDNMNILIAKSMAASGDVVGGVAMMEKLSAEEEARVKANPKVSRSLNLLLGLTAAQYELGLTLESAKARVQLVKAAKSAQVIIESFQRAGLPEDGYPPEYYEAYWIKLDGAYFRARTAGASPQTVAQAKEIPILIQRLREEDSKGFANSPLVDFFEQLELKAGS